MYTFTGVGEGEAEVLRFAAQELDGYLKRMVPDRKDDAWSVLITVDPALGSPCRNDCFQIAITENGGTIVGNRVGSVLLGVYDYLRRLGCRFLAPGSAHERVPVIPGKDLCLSYFKQAEYYHRGVCIEGADSCENIMDFIDWLPKAGYNTFFLQFRTPWVFMERFYHHEGNPGRMAEPFTREDAEACQAVFEKEIKRRGLWLHEVGHGWTARLLGYDTDSWEQVEEPDRSPAADSDRFPAAKWAAQLHGRRGLYQGVPVNTNLCYSSREAVNAFADRVLAYAKAHPQTDYLHIWLADTCNNVCECSACRKTTLSDQYIFLLNEIDKRLTEEKLTSVKLVFLLYQELLWPPVKERLNNPDRFVLMFAPISRTFEASYDPQKAGKELPAYRRNEITLPENLGENLAFLKGWQEIFKGDAFVYDYPLGRAHYGDFGYLHIAKVIGGDIRQLKYMGLDGMISCQELRAFLPNALPNYVMGRMLFDGDADEEDVTEEYFSAAYGVHAPEARAFLQRLSADQCCDYMTGKGARTDPAVAAKMRDAIACCRSFEREMESETSCCKSFWSLLAYHCGYVRRLASLLLELSEGHLQNLPDKWKELQGYLGEGEEAYEPYLDVYRVLEVLKTYTLPKEETDEA